MQDPPQLCQQNVVSNIRSVLLTANCDDTFGHLQYMLVITDFYSSLAVGILLLIIRISLFSQAEKIRIAIHFLQNIHVSV